MLTPVQIREDFLRVLSWEPQDVSLAFGLAGKCLYLLENYHREPSKRNLHFLSAEVNRLISVSEVPPGLFNGLAGTVWILKKVMDAVALPELNWKGSVDILHRKLREKSKIFLTRPGRYELFNGAAGIGIVALTIRDEELLKTVNDYLLGLSGNYYRLNDTSKIYSEGEPLTTAIDFGVSHGIPGVILYLNYFLKKKGSEPRLEKLLQELTQIFQDYALLEPGNFLPKFYPGGAASTHQGWCYGNLSTSLALFEAGDLLGSFEITKYAEKLAQDVIPFFLSHEFPENHLCHGSASFLPLMRALKPHLGNGLNNLEEKARASLSASKATDVGLLTGLIGEALARACDQIPSVTGWESLFLLEDVR